MKEFYGISPIYIRRAIQENEIARSAKAEEERRHAYRDQKELSPYYSLESVSINEKSKNIKIEFCEYKKYKTIERYVTRNYVKYPVLSDWKTKTKKVSKSIRLADIDGLLRSEDELIVDFAEDIVYKLRDQIDLPRWFLNAMAKKEQRIKENEISQTKEEKTKVANGDIDGINARIRKIQQDIAASKNALEAAKARSQRLKEKKEKWSAAPKSVAKSIFSFGLYAFLRSEKHVFSLGEKYRLALEQESEARAVYNRNVASLQEQEEILSARKDRLSQELAALDALIQETKEHCAAILANISGESAIRITPLPDPVSQEYVHTTRDVEESWKIVKEKVEHALFVRNFENAMKLLFDAMGDADMLSHAITCHFTLLDILGKMYYLREENPIVYQMCLTVCDYDMGNAERLFFAMNNDISGAVDGLDPYVKAPFRMGTPTKKAIILEKLGDLDGAIAVCEQAMLWNIADDGHNSFEARKQRLEKKREKLLVTTG